jgi:hypothetical protein
MTDAVINLQQDYNEFNLINNNQSSITKQNNETSTQANQNYQHYAELREQKLRARETIPKPM